MTTLSVDGLTKRFGALTALENVTLGIDEGEFFSIVGPSNAGKSTLLKTVAGLHRPDLGKIAIMGRDVTNMEPKQRGVSLLFQNIALFPNLTGFENIAFPLTIAGMPRSDIQRRVSQLGEILHIGHVLNRLPRTYSGGEQQRVAIARAIAMPSELLMLDEPLSNLDARIRIALRLELKRLRHEMAKAVLYVTHDQIEAMSLSDRIAVLHEGRVQQVGTPEDVFHFPANRIVAKLFGSPPMNIISVEIRSTAGQSQLVGDGFETDFDAVKELVAYERLPREVDLGLQPTEIRIGPAQTTATPFASRVLWLEHLGSKLVLDVELGESIIKVVVPHDHPVRGEGPAWLGFSPNPRRLIDRATGQFLR